MGAITFWGLLVGLIIWAKESTTPNTPAENTRYPIIKANPKEFAIYESVYPFANGHGA